MAMLLARGPGRLFRYDATAAARGRLANAGVRRAPHLCCGIRASSRGNKIVDGRSPRRKNAVGGDFIELGGKKEVFAASLIALPCAVVFSMWTWAKWYEEECHDRLNHKEPKEGWFKLLGITTPPPLFSWKSMVQHFTLVPGLLLKDLQPPYVLVTSAFSHIDGAHLAGNMVGLYLSSINIPLPSRLGALRFGTLFLGSAFAGSLASLAFCVTCATRNQDPNYLVAKSFGASGGISGLVMAAVLWRPKAKVLLPIFLIDGIPAWSYLVCTIGYDIFGLAKQMAMTARVEGSQTGHGAHLGGAAFGAAAFAFWRKTLLKF